MLVAIAITLWAATAPIAQSDTFKITPAEQSACTGNATRFCSGAYPDEHRLLSCMETNRPSLSPVCRDAFDAGMKRRGL